MMYSEFVNGTGCKENEHNYKVFKDLEVMYMNSNLSKQEIYEYGKKLVDNSKSEEEIRLEAEIEEEIASYKHQIEMYKKDIEWKKGLIECDPDDKAWIKDCKNMIRYYKQQIQWCRNKISALKTILA